MTKPLNHLVITFITLISFLTFPISSSPHNMNAHNNETYVHEACSVTRYPQLCVTSLAPYSNKARRSARRWARVGVSVALKEVNHVALYLNNLKVKNNPRKKRIRASLRDCVECFQDALDNLHKCLGALRRLGFGGFKEQMGNVLTWLSAALTDEDTCLDGFQGSNMGKLVNRVHDKVQNVSYITSNALALVNNLATTGP